MMMDQVLTCSKLAKASCTGDCQYNEEDSKCDVGADANKKYACDHASSETLMTLGCNEKSRDDCTGNCAWKVKENKCDISTPYFYELFFGKTSGAALTANVELMETCEADSACTTAGCGKGFAGDACGLAMDASLKAAIEKCNVPETKAAINTGTEAAKAACTGDCVFSENEGRCNPSPATMGVLCGWPAAGTDDSVSVALRLQLSPLAAVLLATCASLMWG